jgi:hypothetical protein
MPTRVQLPDGNIGEFPDGMSQQDIEGVLAKQYPQKAAAPPQPQGSPAPKVGSLTDTISNVGTHLKNMVMGPVSSFMTPPEPGVEQGIANSQLGQAGVGLYRMFAKPTVDAISSAHEQFKKGNLYSKDEYDAKGNYTPSAFSSAVDAIPVAGPWARNVETEAHQKGMAPALAGMATDVLAPKGIAKVGGAAMQTVGKGAQMASTTPQALKLAATRTLVPGNPGELLQSALKPGVKYGANVSGSLQSAIPDVLAADPSLQGVSGFARASDAAKDAAYQPYNNLISPYRPPVGGIGPVRLGSINGAPISEGINSSIPPINAYESARPVGPPSDWTATRPNTTPGIIQSTAERAEKYNREIPVATADALREDANAKLNAFYAKTGGDQNAALSNPETAAVKAIGDNVRGQLYPKLEADNGLQPGDVAAMQQKFGQLSDVSDIANRREPVFARHDPVSLSQKIVSGHGNPLSMAWNYAVQKGLTNLTNSDALVNSAVDRFQNPMATPLPPRAGLFPQMGSGIGRGLYGAGTAASKLPVGLNPLFYSAAANPPKR